MHLEPNPLRRPPVSRKYLPYVAVGVAVALILWSMR